LNKPLCENGKKILKNGKLLSKQLLLNACVAKVDADSNGDAFVCACV